MRLFIVANVEKPLVRSSLDELLPWLRERVQVVAVETDHSHDIVQLQADVALVMGGDGTLLSVARRLLGKQIPLMGINFGKLGFLSSFSPQNFKEHFTNLCNGRLPVNERMMLEASVLPVGARCDVSDTTELEAKRRFVATGLNDAVITAGPPFHMIEMEISEDVEISVKYRGDGLIVATPSGSTAYNVSAGGPLMDADVQAFCITPLCPHSLSFRPIVVSADSIIRIMARTVNEGTTLFCDGQASTRLQSGERVIIRRAQHKVQIIENPDTRGWRTLAEKLNWALSPNYNV